MSITSNTSASSHTAEWDPSCHSPACSNALTCTHYADTPPVLQHTNTRLCVLLVSSLFNLNFHERQKSFYCSHFKTAQTLMDFIRWCCTSSDISFWRNWRVHFPVFLVSVYCLNLCFCHTWLFSFPADYNLLNKLAISHSSVVRRAYEVIPDHGSIFGHCLLNAYPQSNWRKWCSGKEKKQLWRLLFCPVMEKTDQHFSCQALYTLISFQIARSKSGHRTFLFTSESVWYVLFKYKSDEVWLTGWQVFGKPIN